MIPLRGKRGQALVEAALILPCVLALLAGGHLAGRTASILAAAESGAFAQVLRDGRRLPDVRDGIAGTILPRGEGVALHAVRGPGSRILPSPFPSLAGRTSVRAEVRRDRRDAEKIVPWEENRFSRQAEASVDCWDAATPSGRRLRGAVRSYVAAGALF